MNRRTDDPPAHLSGDQQAAALAEWGRPGSFRCCVCGRDSNEAAPLVVRSAVGFGMAACKTCGRRMGLSASFRRRAQRRATDAALRTLLQRVADLVGVTGAALLGALPLASLGDPAARQRADLALCLPLGSIAAAFAQVQGSGVQQ